MIEFSRYPDEKYINGLIYIHNELANGYYFENVKNRGIDVYWYKDGKIHHDTEPAIVYSDGEKQWVKNGNLHRENDLPAVEFGEKCKKWYFNGKLHRITGPAKIWSRYPNWYSKYEEGIVIEHYINGNHYCDENTPHFEHLSSGHKFWFYKSFSYSNYNEYVLAKIMS